MNLSPGTIATLAVPLAVVGFVCFWCAIVWLVGRVGGWHTLAVRFPAGPRAPLGVRWFHLESLELGASRYKGSATVGVAPNGLHLSTMALFRVGHAPIFIPWNAIQGMKTEKQFWQTATQLFVPLENRRPVTITLYNANLAAAIAPHLTPIAGPMR